jgi:hypothetical protein
MALQMCNKNTISTTLLKICTKDLQKNYYRWKLLLNNYCRENTMGRCEKFVD